MTYGLYVERPGALHRVDPRAKVLMLVCGFTVPFLFSSPAYTGATLLISAGAAVAVGCTESLVRLRWLFLTFITMTVLLWALLRPGPTIVWWRLSVEGLLYGLGAGLKIVAGMSVGALFLGTTTGEETARGLVGLGVPYPAAFAFALSLQMIPGFVATAVSVRDAQRARGLDLESGGVLRRTRAHLPLLAPVMLATLRQSDQLAMALECRGFRAHRRRTWLHEPRFGAREALLVAVSLAYLATGIAVRTMGYGTLTV